MDASSKPEFFKVLINDFSTRLQFPPAFVNKFGKQIPNKTKIKACNEKSWEVEVQKLGENFNFSEGWGNFVEENKLEFGDFLVFKLLADSKFKVKIFGKTCCVKEFPSSERNSEVPLNGKIKEKEDHRKVEDQGKRKWVDEVDDNDGYSRDEELNGSARRKKCEFEKYKDCEEEDVIAIDSDSFDDKTGVLKQRRWKGGGDEQIKFNSQYNFFQVKLTYSNVNGGYLYIPKSFRKHMKMMKKEQKVKFQIYGSEFNSSMGLQLIYGDRRSETMREIRICQGWRLFVKNNDLKIGDMCIFEMITSDDDDDEVTFIVHVHRWDGAKSKFVKIF